MRQSRNFVCATLIVLCSIAVSCTTEGKKSTIATFQQRVSSWDETLYSDFRAAAAIFDGPEYVFNFAADAEEEAAQIDEAVRKGVDAIVVNALDVEHVLPSIERAFDSGVYVVLVGNQMPTNKFHSYSGMNNREIGSMAGHLVEGLLSKGGNLIELGGKTDQTWIRDRMEGFHDILDANESVNIIATYEGDWTQTSAHSAMDSLRTVINPSEVDLVYSYSDDVLLGAIKSDVFPNSIFIGSDGIPGESLQYVSSGEIMYSILSQTGGLEAIESAYCLVNGMICDKFRFCHPVLINSMNVNAVANSVSKINFFSRKSADLREQLDAINVRLSHYLPAVYLAVILIFLNLIFVTFNLALRKRHRKLKEETTNVIQQNTELNSLALSVEREKMILEKERKELVEAATSINLPAEEISQNKNLLFVKFKASMDKHFSDANFSIDDIALELGVSRAQLFRKVKAQSGETPNNLLQTMRLKKADEMLRNTDMTVSEIAYSTGFSSPSYFTKCYKDKFGKLPTDGRQY